MPFLSRRAQSVGTSDVTIGGYVVAAGKVTTVIGMSVANRLTSDVTYSAWIQDNSGSPIKTALVLNAPLAAGSSEIIIGGDHKVVLAVGDRLVVAASVANALDVITSLLEVDQ